MFHCTILGILSLSSMLGNVPSGPFSIQLGSTNQENGLAVASGGDGTNSAETAGGSSCRRVTGKRSHYMYIKADEKQIQPGNYDAYVMIEFFDDRAGVVRLEYDKVPVDRAKNSFYAGTEDVLLAVGSQEWRRGVIHLPDARFGHGQNGRADFRLVGRGLAVRKIEVAFSRPAGYRPGGIDAAMLDKIRVSAGPGMELDMGCDAIPAEATLIRVGIHLRRVVSHVAIGGRHGRRPLGLEPLGSAGGNPPGRRAEMGSGVDCRPGV